MAPTQTPRYARPLLRKGSLTSLGKIMLGENYLYKLVFLISMKYHSFGREEGLVDKIGLPKIGSKAVDSTLKDGVGDTRASVLLFPYYWTVDSIKDAYYHISKKPHLHVESILDL